MVDKEMHLSLPEVRNEVKQLTNCYNSNLFSTSLYLMPL